MRYLLKVRRQYRAFGRGTLRLLDVQPKSVLAYTRVDADETFVVVNNLAPDAVTVTLPLTEFAGRTPVDVLTDETLPVIAAEGVSLTLPRYGYCWLRLT